MMQASDFYHRLVYRDILAYAIPGALLVSSVWAALTPVKINGYELKPPASLSLTELIALLGIGFIVAHLLAILPRYFLQSENQRRKSAESAFRDDRVVSLEPWLKEAFESVFDKGSWTKLDEVRKRECIRQWVNAYDLRTDQCNRIGAVRLFCENATLMMPLILITLAISINITNAPLSASQGILIILAILFMLLAYLGGNEIRMLEDREYIFIFVRYYFLNRNSMPKIPIPADAFADKDPITNASK